MSDLIDRQALAEKKFQPSECRGLGEGAAYRQGWNDAIDAIIDNEPSADVQPVIYCKDCIYWTQTIFGCACTISFTANRITQPCDFCSFAERKTDGSD